MSLQSLCMDGIQSSHYDSLLWLAVSRCCPDLQLWVPLCPSKSGKGWLVEVVWRDLWGHGEDITIQQIMGVFGIDQYAEVDTVEPNDISYVSSAYAPLTVCLIHYSVGGWSGSHEDILCELPGCFYDVIQQHPLEDLVTTRKWPITTATTCRSLASPLVTAEGKKKPVLVVMYMSGVTYIKLAALQFLSKRQRASSIISFAAPQRLSMAIHYCSCWARNKKLYKRSFISLLPYMRRIRKISGKQRILQ